MILLQDSLRTLTNFSIEVLLIITLAFSSVQHVSRKHMDLYLAEFGSSNFLLCSSVSSRPIVCLPIYGTVVMVHVIELCILSIRTLSMLFKFFASDFHPSAIDAYGSFSKN